MILVSVIVKHKKKAVPVAGYENLQPTLETEEKFDTVLYQRMIGSLMYAMTLTRPDIAFVLGCLARHMSNPASRHNLAAKELMRYLRSTLKQKLRFGPERKITIIILSCTLMQTGEVTRLIEKACQGE